MKVVSSSFLTKRTGSERSNADVRKLPIVKLPCISMPLRIRIVQELHISPEVILEDHVKVFHEYKEKMTHNLTWRNSKKRTILWK